MSVYSSFSVATTMLNSLENADGLIRTSVRLEQLQFSTIFVHFIGIEGFQGFEGLSRLDDKREQK